MDALAPIPSAASRDELIRSHQELHRTLAAALAQLDPTVFFACQGRYWSPAQHLDHLVRSVKPLARALGLPRLALRLLFGRAETSRRPEEVVEVYLAKLAAGGGAGGRFLPATVEDPSREAQEKLADRWLATGEALAEALGKWNDADFDRFRLPHPLLGKLTVREMVAWSLYHGYHHWARMAERSGGLLKSAPSPGSVAGACSPAAIIR